MRAEERATARRQLDQRLTPLRDAHALTRPPRGWIKAIREALGMTTAQLAARLGVSQPRVVAIEKAETRGTLQIDSLERAAQALDCQLVYALVPREPLEQTIRQRARTRARRRLAAASHSMILEAQGVDAEGENEQLQRLIQRLIDRAGSELWDPEP